MCRATYGAAESSWDGDAIAKSLRSFSVLADEAAPQAADMLPPLSPVTQGQ